MEQNLDVLTLRKALPKGYIKVLQKRIKKKHKKSYVATSICRGLTPKYANTIIINEAILLLNELNAERYRLAEEIRKIQV